MGDQFGELENVKLFREIIQSSLGPNGLSKLCVSAQDGKILASNANIYENFFSQSTIQTNNASTNNNNDHKGGNATQSSTPTPTPTSTPTPTHTPAPVTTISTMVAALLKGQQYMLNECKDGSTSVVLLAASFLEIGFKLHMEGISRNIISEIFQKASLNSISILDAMPKKNFKVNWSSLSQAQYIFQLILGTKLTPRDSSSLSNLLAVATSAVSLSVVKQLEAGNAANHVNFIRVCPCVGGDVSMSNQLDGIVVPYPPVSAQKINNDKSHVAIFAIPLNEKQTKMNLVANLSSTHILKQWQKEEEQILKDIALRIAEAGANIVISSGTVHKYILHWFDIHGIVVIQSVPKSDLIYIAEATGAKLIYQTNSFDHLDFGIADSFETLSISGQEYSHLNVSRTVSLLVRGPTRHKTNRLVKSCHDALAVVRGLKHSLEGGALIGEAEVICGGGVPEMVVSSQLHMLSYDPLENYITEAFASGFEIIPKCLLDNSGAPNGTFQHLKEHYQLSKTSVGITKTGTIEELNLEEGMILDFISVKRKIWSTAADIASLLLVVNDSVVGNSMQ